MIIGFVTTSYPTYDNDVRGSHVHRLAAAIVASDVRVKVVAPGETTQRFVLDGVEVFTERCRGGLPGHTAHGMGGIVSNLRRRPWQVGEVAGVTRALSRAAGEYLSDVQILHGHWLVPGGWIATRYARNGRPSVVTAHGTDVALMDSWALRPLAEYVLTRAAWTIAVSEAMRERILRLGAEPRRTSAISIGVQWEDRFPERSYRGPLRVLYVGALRPAKSVETLIKAAAEIASPDVIEVSIVGDGPSRKSLMRLKERLGVRNVEFEGAATPSEVRRHMESAHLLVMPSRSEGKPAVVMEAMAAGLPVLGSAIAGIQELVEEGVTGRLFDPGDVAHLVTLLGELSAERDRVITMAIRAHQNARRLDVAAVADHYVDIYKRVLST